MRHSARLGSFVSGLTLYSAAMLLAGALAGRGLPSELLSSLGEPESLSQLLGEALIYALPMFLLALGWSYVTVRPTRRGRRPTTGWCVAGLALAWLVWVFYGAFDAAAGGGSSEASLAVKLLSPLEPPLWGGLTGPAVLLGVLVAGSLINKRQAALPPRKRRHSHPMTEAGSPD